MDCKSPGPRWELIEQGSACAGGADLQGISAPKAEPGRGPRRMRGRREQEAAEAIRSDDGERSLGTSSLASINPALAGASLAPAESGVWCEKF